MNRIRFPLRTFSLFRHVRIKHKLFVLILFIMAISYGLTYTVLQYAYSIYDEQLYEKSSQVLNLSSASIENELKKIENLTFGIVTDPTIQSKLSEVKDNPPDYEQYKVREKTSERLALFAGAEKYAISADIFDTQDYTYSAGLVQGWTEEERREVWRQAESQAGSLVWVYTDEPGSPLMAVRLIRSYNSNVSLDLDTLGVLAVRVRLSQIAEDVLNGTELKRGELFISAGSTVLYPAPVPSVNGVPPMTRTSPPDIRSAGSKSGYGIREEEGHRFFLSQIGSSYTGWTYSSRIPFDTIFEGIIWMKKMLVLVFSGGLILMILIAIRVARNITVPIEDLIGRMKMVQRGDFTPAAFPEAAAGAALPRDEVGQLHRTFRMMVQQIEELIRENYAKQLTIKDSQFKALQAQINPHFLYNTLESINWEAKLAGQQQISSMVESLGFLLRSSISQKQSIITVGQELDIIRHYLTIQQLRFEERLQVEWLVPPAVHACPIPKLTLQPLVENAIVHGLESMVEPCTIRIRAYEEDGGVVVAVEDNGPGIPQEQLELVNRGEFVSKGNGIGLGNIRDRLRLAFGGDDGLRIESTPGEGTAVYVWLPYERRDS